MKKTVVTGVLSVLIGMVIGTLVVSRTKASIEGRASGPVDVWVATFPDAPFKYHVITFNSDGTMQQANPDAGDARTSDSDGMGIWVKDGDRIKGKFVEITADRSTHAYVSRGEISFSIAIRGDVFTGDAVGKFYDLDNKLVVGPVQTAFNGSRVTLP